jgi:uncharacterized RDD family membrane protein YckC
MVMSAQVNGDSGPAMPRELLDPASARPLPHASADSHGALRRTVEASQPTHAGVVTRLLAAAVDAVVVVVLTALLDLAAAGARFLWSPVDFRWPQPTVTVSVVVLLLVAVVYLAAGWALAGRTYGMRLMGLRVLSSRNQLLGWTRSILRALMSVLWPVGLLWCGISRTRSSFADVVLRTVVVYDAQPYARIRDGAPPGPPGRVS